MILDFVLTTDIIHSGAHLEIIIINERKNKTLNFLINWSIFTLINIVIIAVLILFVYGVINFARGRGDYKRLQQLTRENGIVQRELELMETEIKSLNAILDSLAKGDTVLKNFAALRPLEAVISYAGEEGVQKDSVENKNLGQLSTNLDELLSKVENQYSTNKAILAYLNQKEHLKNFIPSIAPVNGWFMRGFGYCLDPFTGTVKMHEGIDIAAPIGTPIFVTANGVVKKVQNTKDFGIIIEVNHNQDFITIYAHCQNPRVNNGQSVKRGDIIGYVGASGKTTGPHLHYEIRISGVPVDPLDYIILNTSQ